VSWPFRRLPETKFCTETAMIQWLGQFWADQEGQDVAEYGVMLAVVLVIVMGTIRLIGQNAGNIFSQVGSSIH